jgi:hypothetical protein
MHFASITRHGFRLRSDQVAGLRRNPQYSQTASLMISVGKMVFRRLGLLPTAE